MHAVDVAFGVGWLLFWGYWLASASGVKSGRSQWGRFAGFRLLLWVIIFVLARALPFRPHANHSPWMAAVGLVLFVMGLGLAIWARINLGRNWGMPMTEKDDPELVTSGPYRWIRNPIYSGLILAMIGTAIGVSVDWLVVVALVGGYFVYSAIMEQRFMAEKFPATYPAYRASTKMLIPFVF